MTEEEQQAYNWALKQQYQSVAATYARILAKHIQRQETTNLDLLAACELVEPAIGSLLDELGQRKATDWGLVNACLVAVAKAIAKAKSTYNRDSGEEECGLSQANQEAVEE